MRCEEISLTGNLCTQRKHDLPGKQTVQEEIDGEKPTKKALPSMPHTSGMQYIAACNCGRKQANREDPYTLYEANYGFYAELEEDCCKDLQHLTFPIFNPLKVTESSQAMEDQEQLDSSRLDSVTRALKIDCIDNNSEESRGVDSNKSTRGNSGAALDINFNRSSSGDETDKKEQDRPVESMLKETAAEEVVKGVGGGNIAEQGRSPTNPDAVMAPVTAGSDGQGVRTAGTPTLQDETDIILEVLENIHIDAPSGKSPSKVESLFTRTNSRSLPHMKTLSSVARGLKPEFPSWSLVLMGSNQMYSHSAGLASMPGFMSSSKFLLPWEVPLTKVSEAELETNWSHILEYAARRASLVTGNAEEMRDKISVKVFLGFEYECQRGHRFMVSAPDKPMKSSSTMRGAAQELVSSDMPLYMACPCRPKSPPVAQLMRIHLVTPKAPVHVTLLPQVQPVAGGPIFVSGWDTPARLSISSYWVLRLPLVYCGEGGSHLPPLTPPTKENPSGVLLKGCIGVDEAYVES